jgi:hypothetical protein
MNTDSLRELLLRQGSESAGGAQLMPETLLDIRTACTNLQFCR